MDRQLPQSTENEIQVLGVLILDVNNDVRDDIFELLQPNHFFDKDRILIYRTLLNMSRNNEYIELVSLRDKLKHAQQLEGLGGVDTLLQLCESTPSIVNGVYYAEQVLLAHQRRQVIAQASKIQSMAYDSMSPLSDIMTETERISEVVAGRERPSGIAECVDEVMEGILNPTDRPPPLPTPWFELNSYLDGGFRPGELIVVAGRPSMGKSIMAMNIARYLAVDMKKPVQILSFEMRAQNVMERLLVSSSGVPMWKMRHPRRIDDESIAQLDVSAASVRESPLHINDRFDVNIEAIKVNAKSMRRKHGIEMLVVDHMGLIGDRRITKKYELASMLSREFKMLAEMLEIPIIIVCQLNRGNESRDNKRPYMSDLRDSGDIEQNANIIILVHREDYYHKDEEGYQNTNIAEGILAKNRDGETGLFPLAFDGSLMRFENK